MEGGKGRRRTLKITLIHHDTPLLRSISLNRRCSTSPSTVN